MMASVTVKYGSGERIVEACPGDTVMDCLRREGIAIDAPCSGHGTCGKCRIRVLRGEADSRHSRHITDAEYAQGWRLACETRPAGDAVILVPEASSAYRDALRIDEAPLSGDAVSFESMLRQAKDAGSAFGCGLRVYDLALDPPSLDDTLPDNERLVMGIRRAGGPDNVTIAFCALRKLARVLRAGNFRIRCVARVSAGGAIVTDVLPEGDDLPLAGLAVDLGTTSVSMVLVDLEDGRVLARASAANAQIRYGADVINRIMYSERDGGSDELRRAVVDETLKPLMRRLCADAGIPPTHIYRVCVAGNTTMNHLLLGLCADPIRTEPYIPSFLRVDGLTAAAIGLEVNPEAELLIMPNVGSYVGGDITAGVFASMMWRREETALFVDLGTNGELVLGNDQFMLCCACSAGPAFEGGDISCGMRAAAGAVDHCGIDPETMEPSLKTIGSAETIGLCGSGLIDMVAELFRCGIVNGKGRFIREGARIRCDENGISRYVFAYAQTSGDARELALTEGDIDSFIRAKGAVFSAAMTMLDSIGFTPDMLERIYVAGGIGSGIDMKKAVSTGMLPDVPQDRFTYIGNASLFGAYLALVSEDARNRIDEIARGMTYLELSSQPGYMDAFVAACFIPHTDARLFPSV